MAMGAHRNFLVGQFEIVFRQTHDEAAEKQLKFSMFLSDFSNCSKLS